MLNAKDLELLAAKGIGEKQIEEQLACFVKGFPGNYSIGVGRERDYDDPAGKTGNLHGCLECLSGKE